MGGESLVGGGVISGGGGGGISGVGSLVGGVLGGAVA